MIKTWEDFHFVVKIVFGVNSLLRLENCSIFHRELTALALQQNESFYYLLGLVKLANRQKEAEHIFKLTLRNKYEFSQLLK